MAYFCSHFLSGRVSQMFETKNKKNDPFFAPACILRYVFLNYRTVDIEIDIFNPSHQIINRIVKLPLSHSLNGRGNSVSFFLIYFVVSCTQ
jgi:hypothetical protein